MTQPNGHQFDEYRAHAWKEMQDRLAEYFILGGSLLLAEQACRELFNYQRDELNADERAWVRDATIYKLSRGMRQ